MNYEPWVQEATFTTPSFTFHTDVPVKPFPF